MTALKMLLSNSSSPAWFMRMPSGWRRRQRRLPLGSKLDHNRMSSGLSGAVKHVNMSLTRWTHPCASCLVLRYLLPVDIFPPAFLPRDYRCQTVLLGFIPQLIPSFKQVSSSQCKIQAEKELMCSCRCNKKNGGLHWRSSIWSLQGDNKKINATRR